MLYNNLSFISDAHVHGEDDPPKKKEDDFTALKEKNPDFQKIFDMAIGKGKSEVQDKFQKEIEAAQQEKKRLLQEYQNLESQFTGGQKEREELQKKIADLEEQTMSAEERSQKKYKLELEKRDSEIKKLNETALAWQNDYQNLFTETEIRRAISQGDYEAVNPSQVVDLLKPRTELAPIMDDKGNETGKFKVVLKNIAKNGEEPKDYDFSEGFKLWAEKPDNDNLFKSRIKGGGSDRGGGPTRLHLPGNVDLNDPDEYRKNRDEILANMKNK